MRITVRLFAALRERAGVSRVELEVPAGATVGAATEMVGARYAALAPMMHRVALAVNLEYADLQTELHDGDELALIPAVSGGSPDADDWLAILATPLSGEAALRFIEDPKSGGHAVFLGTTRAESQPQGRTLVALDYEAYESMAIRQFREMAAEAREKWPVLKLVILHRSGRVNVGEASVLIAVLTPHRGEAFEACRWLIDTLKGEATIWKKQVWSDGGTSWPGSH